MTYGLTFKSGDLAFVASTKQMSRRIAVAAKDTQICRRAVHCCPPSLAQPVLVEGRTGAKEASLGDTDLEECGILRRPLMFFNRRGLTVPRASNIVMKPVHLL